MIRDYTLVDVIERNAVLFGNRTAFVSKDARLTHHEFATHTARLAAGLAGLGLSAGERIAVLAPNCVEFAELIGAAARLGAIVVPVNWRLSPDEVGYVLSDANPRIVVASREYVGLVPAAVGSGARILEIGGDSGRANALEHLRSESGAPASAARSDDPILMIHTAAVSGRPRGALLTHRGLVAAGMQTCAAWQLVPDDVNVGMLPMFHLAALSLMLAVQQAGGSTWIAPGFDPNEVVRVVDEEGGSVLGSFAPMLEGIVEAATRSGSRLESLRIVTGIEGAEAIGRLSQTAPRAVFWSAYGQTETSGFVTMDPANARPGSAGRPGPLTTLAILDDADRPLPPGTPGEIGVRGPMVFAGYWGLPEDNAFTFRSDWHHTGDQGKLDEDGFLFYLGRSPAKELIKTGGENVYPAEVERALLEHPVIAEAVVFGVADPRWGEAVKAVCACAPDQPRPDEAAVIEFVGARIARYKRPRSVVFVDSLPRTAAGSLDRAAIKAAHSGT